jgi:hypothetical protein
LRASTRCNAPAGKNPPPPSKRSIASAEDAGRVFAIVKPKLAVVYHYKDEEGLGDAVRKEYNGPFVIARDLMVINIGKSLMNAALAKDESQA